MFNMSVGTLHAHVPIFRSLLKQLEDTQRENYEVTEYLRSELLQKTERIAEMEAEMAKVG